MTEAIVVHQKILSGQLHGGTEDNYENSQDNRSLTQHFNLRPPDYILTFYSCLIMMALIMNTLYVEHTALGPLFRIMFSVGT